MASQLLVGTTLVLVLGVGAQWLAWRLRLPAILVLLVFGLLAGPGGRALGWSNFLLDPATPADVILPFVSLGVALILFEGGLTLRLAEIAAHGRVVASLVTLGAGVAWLLATLAAWLIAGLAPGPAVLLGGILVVTGPTVIGPLLRFVRPTGPAGPILKWEGIVIDPIGVVLALLVFEFLVADSASGGLLAAFENLGRTIVVGGLLGLVAGRAVTEILRRAWVPDHLDSPATLMVVLGVFTLGNTLQSESGLLAVTLMAIVLANQRAVDLRHVLDFKENLSVLVIASLFILLAGRIELSALRELDWRAGAFIASLVLVVRPASVWIATLGSGLRPADRMFIAWMAPRGIVAAAVSSVFALELEHAGVEGARSIVPLMFAVIMSTVALYGLTSAPLARRLGIAVPDPQGLLLVGAAAWVRELAALLQEHGVRVQLVDTNPANVWAARAEGLSVAEANVLADAERERLDLGGIGRVLAVTPNDTINTLVVRQFAHELGRQNVYRLAPKSGAGRAPGRILFGAGETDAALQARLRRGARFAAQRGRDLPPGGETGLLLMVLGRQGKVTLSLDGQRPKLAADDLWVGLVGGETPAGASGSPSPAAGVVAPPR